MTVKAWIVIGVELLLSAMVIYILIGEVNKQSDRADKATYLAQQKQETINDLQARQKDVAALDEKYIGELADAKATIEKLHDDVTNGTKRLQLNATCKRTGKAAGTSSMDDGASARPTDAAQRDYFILRDRIEISNKQITGLQEYVRTQCIR
ncbi:MAG: lysis protein [Ewingella americana]|jgi:prophage endopeptidase|uniref:lysis protein n=1 Tax=Ewingella americana TaxID=41202 RepID=UPI002431C9B6|nr:lysis protein [Ewingella americana]MCI1676618.1 lysis protein [Ewingella americana]MCI1853792.1 lysis protein [Ewingella americana]MCI1859967.1 lysis protein [Ewingella americana]MCI2142295.1 lysis protein [Ewingella americana]MCI2163258.1 lysis protein [Ewingella americana]